MERLKKLWRFLTAPEMLLYLVFGVLTTAVNFAVFALCDRVLAWPWELSTLLAWLLSVVFAFFTNKLVVFKSRSFAARRLLWELLSFFAARVFSLGADMAGMWLMVDLLRVDSLLAKLLMNVIVVVINYVLSKLFIFSKVKK